MLGSHQGERAVRQRESDPACAKSQPIPRALTDEHGPLVDDLTPNPAERAVSTVINSLSDESEPSPRCLSKNALLQRRPRAPCSMLHELLHGVNVKRIRLSMQIICQLHVTKGVVGTPSRQGLSRGQSIEVLGLVGLWLLRAQQL